MMTTTTKITNREALKRCEVFSNLDDATLDAVAASIIEKEFEAGTTIFSEGDAAVELLIPQEGKVALQMTTPSPEGLLSRRITVDVAGPNEIIGWSAVVEPFVYTLTGVCLQHTRVISISSSKLRWLMEGNLTIGFQILTGLSRVIAARLSDTRQVLVSERMPITTHPSP